MSEPSDEDIARFSYPRSNLPGRRALLLTYREVRVTIHYSDTTEGNADLDRLFNTLPELMATARREMQVTDSMKGFDAEVEKFWDDEDSK